MAVLGVPNAGSVEMSERLSERPIVAPLRVSALMATPPRGVDQFDTLVDAARRMRATGLRAVPVTDERSRFLGMLSDRDILEDAVAAGQNPSGVSTGSLVRPGQATIDPSRVADEALLAMLVAQPLAELPVVQDGRLVGILTVADLAVPLLDQLEESSFELNLSWPDDSRR
jgi:CBS domain-containing protein